MNTDQVLEIARLYYEQNSTQEDIARRLSISRSTVARALKLAKERGYIQTVVVSPSKSLLDLEAWFRGRFDLQHVVIVPGRRESQQDLDSVGRAAARYLDQIVSDGVVLTVSGGRTLLSVSQQLSYAQRPNLTVVPVMGGLVTESAISAHEVVREIATRWQARAETLFVPAIVSDATARQAILREDSIRLTLEKAKSATIACIGLAGVKSWADGVARPYESSSGRIQEEDIKQLLQQGAVGETCGQFFDIHGYPLENWNRQKTIAVSLEDLKQMITVVVGTGSEKAYSFLGACRNGFISALIITEDLACEIEQLDKTL